MAVRETLWSLVESTLDAVAELRSGADGRSDAFDAASVIEQLFDRVDALERRLGEVASSADQLAVEAAPTGAEPSAERLDALDERIARTDKRLQMAMAAIQAATTQLMEVKDATATARNQAQQATQRATSAQTAAEAAADGVSTVEEAVATLTRRLDADQTSKETP